MSRRSPACSNEQKPILLSLHRCWCRPWKDFPAAREAGEPLFAWARWTIGCQAKSTLSIDDPLPFVRAALYRLAGEGRKGEAIGVWRARKRSDS